MTQVSQFNSGQVKKNFRIFQVPRLALRATQAVQWVFEVKWMEQSFPSSAKVKNVLYPALLLRFLLLGDYRGGGDDNEDRQFDDAVTAPLCCSYATQCRPEHLHLQTAC
jgi:hypothetical protein